MHFCAGITGKAITLVSTYDLGSAAGDSTRLRLSVHAAGEIEEKTPEIVEKVWEHFLVERLKPFIESGEHLTSAANRKPRSDRFP